MVQNRNIPFKSIDARQVFVNAFGALGYTAVTFVGVFALLFLTLLFLDLPASDLFFRESPSDTPAPQTLQPNPLAYVFTLLLVVLVTAFAVSLPFWLGKYGAKASRWLLKGAGASAAVANLLVVKILLASVTLLIVALALQVGVTTISDGQSAAVLSSLSVLAGSAVFCFAVQTVLAYLLKVNDQKVW